MRLVQAMTRFGPMVVALLAGPKAITLLGGQAEAAALVLGTETEGMMSPPNNRYLPLI